MIVSALTKLYHWVYDSVCGRHPNLRPWHFQWLSVRAFHRELRQVLPTVTGRLLDVGCGQQPYRTWIPAGVEYLGLDIEGSVSRADVWIHPGQAWPIASASVDAVLCTHVIEHVVDRDQFMGELARVLKPGGLFICAVPFAYNVHDEIHDYARFTAQGLRLLLDRDFVDIQSRGIGDVGATLVVLFLNWINMSLSRTAVRRAVKGITLPIWIMLSGLVNVIAVGLDAIDTTGAFYGSAFATARRR